MAAPSSRSLGRSTLERAWNLIPVLRQPTFTAVDLIRSYDALLDLWLGEEEMRQEGPRAAVGAARSGNSGGEYDATTTVAHPSIDMCRNLQVVCALLLELRVLDPGQASVVATSLDRATRILDRLERKEHRAGSDSSEMISDSVLEDLHVEVVRSYDTYDDGCLRYRWSVSSPASVAVSLTMGRALLAAEADELWRMAHTPVPNEGE